MARDDDRRLPRESVVPNPKKKARMECSECGATFPRSEVGSAKKGSVTCPECGSREIRDISDT